MTVLSGLKVVEISQRIPAAYCGRLFAAWGADVVMLEPESGSTLRNSPPLISTKEGMCSLTWEVIAANKRALRLDDAVRSSLADLFARADVLITDLSPDSLSALYASYPQITERHPQLCIVSISPFGLSGPYAGLHGSELVCQAAAGHMTLNGAPDNAPMKLPGRIGAFAVGVNAFVGVLAAYLGRLRSGTGDLVEVSEAETYASLTPLLRHQYLGTKEKRVGGPDTGVQIFECKDGWISFAPANPAQARTIAEALGIEAPGRAANIFAETGSSVKARSFAFFAAHVRNMSAADVFKRMEKAGVAAGQILSPERLLSLEQLRERDFFSTAGHHALGVIQWPGGFAKSQSLKPEPYRPAPTAPEPFTRGALGWNAASADAGRTALDRPLHGIRIADLTQAWIGPYATMLLADLGAEVFKIESHTRPDVWRQVSANPVKIENVQAAAVNRSPNFNSVNRNKRSLTLDLRSEQGQALFRDLVRGCDIVAENFTPRVMERFGLDWSELRSINPGLVFMSASGFGKNGPWTDCKTNGAAIEGLSGWDWLHRYEGEAPMVMGAYQADPICGLKVAAAILVALVRKYTTGDGALLDNAMLDCAAGYISDELLAAQFEGTKPAFGNRSHDAVPNGVFRCKGEDRWIAISIDDDHSWTTLCSSQGAPNILREMRGLDRAGRRNCEDRIEAILSNWFAGLNADDLTQTLQTRGIAASVVRNFEEVLQDPHFSTRTWFDRITHPDCGVHLYNGRNWRFYRAQLSTHTPPPRLGEHRRQVLRDVLGQSDESIQKLEEDGVTGGVL